MINKTKRSLQAHAEQSGSAFLGLALLAAALAAPLPASAYTITKAPCTVATCGYETAGLPETDVYIVTITEDGNTDPASFTVDWLVPAGTDPDSGEPNPSGETLPVDLKASSTWTITSLTQTTLDLDVVINNDTVLPSTPIDANSAILSFGFGVDPDSTATLTDTGTVFDGIGDGSGAQQTFPGSFKQIDVCVFSQGCSGGGINTGLQAGDSDQVSLQVTAGSVNYGDPNQVSLLFFPLKFQGTWGSFEPSGTPGGNGGTPPQIPIPAPLALIGLGLLWFHRKSYRAAT
jgi:MYXO-CTERM domain-containing protein